MLKLGLKQFKLSLEQFKPSLEQFKLGLEQFKTWNQTFSILVQTEFETVWNGLGLGLVSQTGNWTVWFCAEISKSELKL